MMMIQQKCFPGTLDRNGEKKESIFWQFNSRKVVTQWLTRKKIPRTESLTIPTETRAAFAFVINSWTVSGFSEEHPGGTTGRVSWKLNFSYSQQYLAPHFSTINPAQREILKYYYKKMITPAP
jgi:hypothetical protein